ncbi:MAG: polysaccharide pyruvyl transferase CsaB [Peptococcaceae bacterium]|jgi:polysaccharide pyruvyl transferase CsaB|nr:polysaccharide pyruvyl transferase CsaB [Peptococcaceae bacterium]
MKKIVVSGYYGYGNTGDEAVLYAILRTLRKTAESEDLDLIVLSGDPEQTAEAYKVTAVSRWNPVQVLKAIRKADLFISGGGSLIQDVSSSWSPRYYLWLLSMARILAKKVMVYAQGIGPLNNPKLRKKTGRLMEKCDIITVRDVESREDLLRMGVSKEIHVIADPVMALRKNIVPTEPGIAFLRDLGLTDQWGRKKRPVLGVFLRSFRNDRFCRTLALALDQRVRDGWDILMIPMQHRVDMEVAVEIGNMMEETLFYLGKPLTPREILSLTGQLDMVLGMRLHSLILSAVMGVPMIALAYDPKVERFISQLGMILCLHMDDLELEKINESFRWTEIHWREQVESGEGRIQFMYRQAWETAAMAVNLLDIQEEAHG